MWRKLCFLGLQAFLLFENSRTPSSQEPISQSAACSKQVVQVITRLSFQPLVYGVRQRFNTFCAYGSPPL